MPVVIRDGSKPGFDADGPLVTYLNRYHCKRENIRFLAVRPLFAQDLWCSPSCSMTMITGGASNRIEVLSDCSKTKIRDPCVASGIHKDIRLDTC